MIYTKELKEEAAVYDLIVCGGGVSGFAAALIKMLKAQNFVNLYAWITTPNPISEVFHKSMGFEKLCEIPQTGFKMGKWYGITWYRMQVSDNGTPKPIIPFPTLDSDTVDKALIV